MSDEEIVFDGEVAFREPKPLRRPDFDRRFACLDCDVPGPDDLRIFLDLRPADAIERHALRDTSVELGGILLGKECIDEATGSPFVWITEALEARHYENTQASFTYTHDSWQEITRERDLKHPDLDIVGWYHTHPDFGVFLSGHDLFIHHNFFDQPLQVAYVVDPIRQTRGFFRWKGGEMVPVGGFTLTADRADRQALARLANDLEQIPNTESAGGAISPRLEAELIAMLNRPAYPVASADRSLLVAAVPLLCLALGALVTAGVFWLNSLTQSLQEQALAVRDLSKSMEKAAASQSGAIDSERLKIREEILDAFLGDLRDRPGNVPAIDRVNASLAKLAAERDESRKKIDRLETERIALIDQQTGSRHEKDGLRAELAKTKEDSETRIKEMTANLEDLKLQRTELEEKLESRDKLIEDSKAGQLYFRYQIAWYTALGAIVACFLLGIRILATIPPHEAPPAPPSAPRDAGEPPRVVIS